MSNNQSKAKYGVFGYHIPNQETWKHFEERQDAIECAKALNQQPWARNGNRALVTHLASGKGTRSY